MSHLKHFGVGNFKVFKDLTHFDLAPITILTGKNNSGKSSLIKSLLVLRNSNTKNQNTYGGYDFEEWKIDRSELKLGSPNEVFNYEQKSKRIIFELSINNPMIPNGIVSLEYVLDNSEETFYLEAFNIKNENKPIVNFIFEKLELSPNEIEYLEYQKIDFQYFINRIRELIPDKSKATYDFLRQNIGLFRRLGRKNEDILELIESDQVILGINNPIFHNDNDFGSERIEVSNEDLMRIQDKLFELYNKGIIVYHEIKLYSCINSFSVDNVDVANKIREVFNQDDFLIKKYESVCSSRLKNGNLEETIYFEPVLNSFFDYIKTFVRNLFDDLQKEFKNITYLPSIRARNERLYQVSKEGYAIQEIDQKAFEGIDFKNEVIHQFYLDALNDFEIGENIVIKTHQRTATEITIIRNDRAMLLSDLGFGYAQLIPIILNILIMASKCQSWKIKKAGKEILFQRPKILIEEPESNLHPDFQSKLADLFVKASNQFDIQFIIETHSEYFIRRLQYLTAKIDIKPEDISIYYFNNPTSIPNGERQISKIEIRHGLGTYRSVVALCRS